jgi:hypothetical protein
VKRSLGCTEIDVGAAPAHGAVSTVESLHRGIHALLIDLFPPTPRDPLGIHQLVWAEVTDEPFRLPAGKNRILASYEAGDEKIAYVEPLGVGDMLPRS